MISQLTHYPFSQPAGIYSLGMFSVLHSYSPSLVRSKRIVAPVVRRPGLLIVHLIASAMEPSAASTALIVIPSPPPVTAQLPVLLFNPIIVASPERPAAPFSV